MRRLRFVVLAPLMALLSGCNLVILSPSGDIAAQQRDLILISTVLMLLVVLPVMALTILFAWRYRRSNASARYEPDWHHSSRIELIVWAAPLAIIAALGTVTWIATHRLDPYRPLDRIASGEPVTEDQKPLDIQVVALDWKWLFIYPEQQIATVNELAAPVDRPITFHITASSVMNSFFIPALAGQIYAMPGMETKLHAVANEPGVFDGFSANYSGAGFSQMRFKFHGMTEEGFDAWVEHAKAAEPALETDAYLSLERPSENAPVSYYGAVEPDLYSRILNMCVDPGKVCMGQMMAIDDAGGLGFAAINDVDRLAYDKHLRRGGAPLSRSPNVLASVPSTSILDLLRPDATCRQSDS